MSMLLVCLLVSITTTFSYTVSYKQGECKVTEVIATHCGWAGHYYKYRMQPVDCTPYDIYPNNECIYDDSEGETDCEYSRDYNENEEVPCWIKYIDDKCATCNCDDCQSNLVYESAGACKFDNGNCDPSVFPDPQDSASTDEFDDYDISGKYDCDYSAECAYRTISKDTTQMGFNMVMKEYRDDNTLIGAVYGNYHGSDTNSVSALGAYGSGELNWIYIHTAQGSIWVDNPNIYYYPSTQRIRFHSPANTNIAYIQKVSSTSAHSDFEIPLPKSNENYNSINISYVIFIGIFGFSFSIFGYCIGLRYQKMKTYKSKIQQDYQDEQESI